jgi:short-subunit dehydrogenase
MHNGSFEDLTIEQIKETIDVNMYQTGFLMRLFIKKFYKRANEEKRSAIITVSSILGMHSTPGCVIYSASKAFTLFFTLALGYELRDRNYFMK